MLNFDVSSHQMSKKYWQIEMREYMMLRRSGRVNKELNLKEMVVTDVGTNTWFK